MPLHAVNICDCSNLSIGLVTQSVKLLSKVMTSDADMLRKKRLLMDGLLEQFQCCMWFWGFMRFAEDQKEPHVFGVMDGGEVTDAVRDSFVKAYTDQQNAEPMFQAISKLPMFRQDHISSDRCSLVDDRTWYELNLHHQLYRKPHDVDHCIHAYYPLGRDLISVVGMHRRSVLPNFTCEELALLHTFFGEIEWLHRAGIEEDYGREVLELTPRQYECFMYLSTGMSRKQIASFMQISDYTVGDYTKQIYERYGVKSQVQLMVKVYRGSVGCDPSSKISA